MTSECGVIIVAYNSRDHIRRCLPEAFKLPNLRDVVLVDHGRDGSGQVARAAGATVLENPGNPGFGAGQNAGVRATSAPFLLLLNPDAVPVAEGISRGVSVLEESPDVAAVQGVIRNVKTGEPERSGGVELGPFHLLGRAVGARRFLRTKAAARAVRVLRTGHDHVHRVPESPVAVESLAATALLVRRDAFLGVGGFDESFFLYGEDLDLCRRLRAAGWKLVALPVDWALHEQGSSNTSDVERELHWWRGTMQFAARWWSSLAWLGAVLAAIVRAVTLAARRPPATLRIFRAVVLAGVVERRARRSPASAPAPPWPTSSSRRRR